MFGATMRLSRTELGEPMVQNDSVFLTVTEVAELFRCDSETVKRQARSRKLPGFKFGKAWFFRSRDIEGMIDDAIGAAHRGG